ncbi:MAG: DUF4359 domain-containing protein [Spirulinaceae cyanobacterium]
MKSYLPYGLSCDLPKRKISQSAIAITIFAAAMVVTNPNRPAYLEYASTKLAAGINTNNCHYTTATLNIDNQCQKLKNVTKIKKTKDEFLQDFIFQVTKRQNLIFLSLYTTELSGKKYRTLAAFGNFLTFWES